MEFSQELTLPGGLEPVWAVLVDVRRLAACVPGVEDVEELVPLARYRATVKQRVGPFRLEVPLEIHVAEIQERERIRARAAGRDRLTGTAISAALCATLTPTGAGETRLALATTLDVGGRLAALGYPLIRKRAEENVAEFGRRLRALLEAA